MAIFYIIYDRVYGNFMVFLFVYCLYITMHFSVSFWLTEQIFAGQVDGKSPIPPPDLIEYLCKTKTGSVSFFVFVCFFSVSSCIAINSYKKASKIFERNIRNKRLHAKSLVK